MATAQPILTLDFKPNIEVIQRDLEALGDDIKTFREPLKRCVQKVIIPSIQQNFDAGGRPPWQGYAQSTIEFHEMLGTPMSNSMLNRTGALKSVMGNQSNWTISSDTATLQDLPQRVWYGKVHQAGYGGKGGKGQIPARPFVMFQSEDENKIVEVFGDWLDERIALRWGSK